MSEKLKEAEENLNKFLEEHPEMRDYQEEIERRLSKEPFPGKRMEILRFMMAERLDALKSEMSKLHNVTEGVKSILKKEAERIENQKS